VRKDMTLMLLSATGSTILILRLEALVREPRACTAKCLTHFGHVCRWDEETFGLEYDLDLFNIVAVSMHVASCNNSTLLQCSN
jgi:hypothetical protein